LELEGDTAAVQLICKILRPIELGTMKMSLHKADYTPYDRVLEGLLVNITRGQPVKIFKESNSLRNVEDADKLDMLAQDSELLHLKPCEPNTIGSHIHVEYHEGHHWLDSNSEPLVVSHSPSSEEFGNT